MDKYEMKEMFEKDFRKQRFEKAQPRRCNECNTKLVTERGKKWCPVCQEWK